MLPTPVPPPTLHAAATAGVFAPTLALQASLLEAASIAPVQANPAETAASGDTRRALPGRPKAQPAAAAQPPPVDLSAPPTPLAATRPVPTPGGVSPMTLLKTTLAARSPLLAAGASSARPAPGLWVLATARCPLPTGLDLNAWAECTQPLGFKGGELAVLEKPKAGNKAELTGGLYSIARTRYRIGPSLPASPQDRRSAGGLTLTQVEMPGIGGRTYVYIALRPEGLDADGRVVAARVWPVACPGSAATDVSRHGDRCFASTLEAVKAAATAVPPDGGFVLRWIDPTDADAAGDTTGARTYARPPAAVFRPPRKLTPLQAAQPSPNGDEPSE